MTVQNVWNVSKKIEKSKTSQLSRLSSTRVIEDEATSRVRLLRITDLFALALVFVFVFVFARASDILGNGISKDWWGFSNHVSAARVK